MKLVTCKFCEKAMVDNELEGHLTVCLSNPTNKACLTCKHLESAHLCSVFGKLKIYKKRCDKWEKESYDYTAELEELDIQRENQNAFDNMFRQETEAEGVYIKGQKTGD